MLMRRALRGCIALPFLSCCSCDVRVPLRPRAGPVLAPLARRFARRLGAARVPLGRRSGAAQAQQPLTAIRVLASLPTSRAEEIQTYPTKRGWGQRYATPDKKPVKPPEKVEGWNKARGAWRALASRVFVEGDGTVEASIGDVMLRSEAVPMAEDREHGASTGLGRAADGLSHRRVREAPRKSAINSADRWNAAFGLSVGAIFVSPTRCSAFLCPVANDANDA